MGHLSEILKDNKFTPEDLPEFESKLFFEGSRRQRYLVRFFVLMFFASVIATGAIIADSTATVVGAMLVAPLMTPIVASTAALIMGNGKRTWQSLALVAAGVGVSVGVSLVLSMLTVQILNFESNSQITGRVTPSMVDLVIALAAGAVGAFAMSRDDVADSLPGVAIAIALVPPLCVVGISLGNAEWGDAWGSFLLFLTNFLSILLAGGAVFAILGLQKASTEQMTSVNRGKAYRIIAIGVILVTIPLAFTSFKVARDSYAQVQVGGIANEWVQQFDGDYVVESVLVSGGVSQILVTGPELPETITDLGEEVDANVKQIKEVHVKFVPSKDFEYVTTNAD